MKLIKRLFVVVFSLALLLGLGAAGVYFFAFKGEPDWYRRPAISQAAREELSRRAGNKITAALSKLQEMEGTARAAGGARPSDRRPVANVPPGAFPISFTEDELNATFHNWDKVYQWSDKYKAFLTDPAIVLHQGNIVLAGKSADLGTVISMHFRPALDAKGQLLLKLDSVLAGRLPLPGGLFDKYRQQLKGKLQGALPELQRKAKLNQNGSTNREAVSAALAKLLLRSLSDEASEPVLFIPAAEANSGSIPVTLEGVEIENKSLSLTVRPLEFDAREALLTRIREPFDKETALGSGSGDADASGS